MGHKYLKKDKDKNIAMRFIPSRDYFWVSSKFFPAGDYSTGRSMKFVPLELISHRSDNINRYTYTLIQKKVKFLPEDISGRFELSLGNHL